MVQSRISLNTIKVASPCTVSWHGMTGTDTIRHCSQCDNNVYNLSAMTPAEAKRLVEENEGKMCVRFYRRKDGTMMTKDCPLSMRRFRRWIMVLVGSSALLLFSLVTVTMSLFGMTRQTSNSGETHVRHTNTNTGFGGWIRSWIAPEEEVMGDMAPTMGSVEQPVMGKMACPPEKQGEK